MPGGTSWPIVARLRRPLFAAFVSVEERGFVFVSLASLLLIALGWVHPGTIIAQGDRSPLIDPFNEATKIATAWSNNVAYVGEASPYFGFALYLFAYAAFTAVFGVSYGQALVVALELGLCWLGAFRCARILGLSPLAASVAAWAYTLNPTRQIYVLILPTFDLMAAIIPWLFYLLLQAADPQRRRAATLWICLIAALIAAPLAPSAHLIFEIVLGSIAWTFFAATFAADRRAYALWATRTFALAALASVWWTLPTAVAYKSGEILRPITLAGNGWIFARASLLNELRFMPVWQWRVQDYFPWAHIADRSPVLYASTLLLTAGLIVALWFARGAPLRAARFCGALALIALFVSKGTHKPLEWINLALSHLPGMFLFIESLGAVTVAALCLALCLGIALDSLPQPAWRVSVRATAAVIALAATAGGSAAVITGAVFHEASGFEPAMHVRVPDSWRDLASYMNTSAPPGAVLVLPADPSYQVEYAWGYFGADGLARNLLHREVFVPGAPAGYVAPHAQLSIERRLTGMLAVRSALIVPVLHDLGVRFVLYRNDVSVSAGFPFSAGDVHAVFGGNAERRFGELDLYDLGAPAAAITTSAAIVLNDAVTRQPGDQVELRALEERLPRVDPTSLSVLRDTSPSFGENEPPARSVNRVLWRATGGNGSATMSAGSAELRASFAADRTPNRQLIRSYSQLHAIAAAGGLPIPQLLGRDLSGSRLVAEVAVPSTGAVRCNASVGVRPRTASVYSLFVNNRLTATAMVPAGDAPQWVHFTGVRLVPGHNDIIVEGAPHRFGSYEPLLPPRRFSGGAFDPYEGELVFSGIWPVETTRTTSGGFRTGPGILTHIAVRNGASLLLESPVGIQGRASDWIIGTTLHRARYRCLARFNLGLQADLAETLRGCFEILGIHLDNDDVAALTIDSLQVTGFSGEERGEFAPFETLILASRAEQPVNVTIAARAASDHFTLPASQSTVFVRTLQSGPATVTISGTASDISNLGAGRPPGGSESEIVSAAHFGGFYAARIDKEGPHLVMVRDAYHPTWFALSPASGVLALPHIQVDSWRNAWLVMRPGWFVACNVLVLLQLVLAAGAIVLLIALSRSAR